MSAPLVERKRTRSECLRAAFISGLKAVGVKVAGWIQPWPPTGGVSYAAGHVLIFQLDRPLLSPAHHSLEYTGAASPVADFFFRRKREVLGIGTETFQCSTALRVGLQEVCQHFPRPLRLGPCVFRTIGC